MYLDEGALDTIQLANLYISESEMMFGQKVELIWRAEIVRRALLLLHVLAPIYGNVSGNHWKVVAAAGHVAAFQNSLWRQLPNALKALADFSDSRVHSVEKLQLELSDIYSEKMLDVIQACLRDVRNQKIQPRIAVEPIDTPTSALEEHAGLAQSVITSLLNVYQTTFIRDEDQLLRVDVAVPWHRYSVLKINLPQKLHEYSTYLQWNESELREFINLRLEWEFRRVGRSFQRKGTLDAWSTLFESNLRNDYCNPTVTEDSFKYVLRHTHHRPRCLQRLTRKCIEKCAEKTGREVDEIMKGVGGIKIVDIHVKDAIRGATREAWDKELVVEGARRYPKLRELVEKLRGIQNPFSKSELAKRATCVCGVDEAVDILWQSGIIGVELKCGDGSHIERDIVLPKDAHRMYKNAAKVICHTWTLFEYNWEGEPHEVLRNYEADPDMQVAFILHPKSFESLLPKVANDWPIGI